MVMGQSVKSTLFLTSLVRTTDDGDDGRLVSVQYSDWAVGGFLTTWQHE